MKWKSLSRVQLFATPWNFPGKNTRVGSLFLLQRIFPAQGSNRGLLHCRRILYQLSSQGSPKDNTTRTKDKLYMITSFWGLPSPRSLWIKSEHWIYSWVCRSPNKYEMVRFFLLLFFSQWVMSWLFCDPMDCTPAGSSVHGSFQARTLGWVAIFFFRGSSWPRDRTQISHIGGRTLYPLSQQQIPKWKWSHSVMSDSWQPYEL